MLLRTGEMCHVNNSLGSDWISEASSYGKHNFADHRGQNGAPVWQVRFLIFGSLFHVGSSLWKYISLLFQTRFLVSIYDHPWIYVSASFKQLVYVWQFFMFLFCVTCMGILPEYLVCACQKTVGCQSPSNWGYLQLWVHLWVPGIEPGFSERRASALSSWAIFLSQLTKS